MVMHVVTESCLAVFLLLGGNVTVEHLLHEHDFLLLWSYQHEHAGGEISALERVLPVER